MSAAAKPWLARCSQCGFLGSSLQPRLLDSDARGMIDENEREQALGALRAGNFERILDRLSLYRKPVGALLDIGCAHGWFLEAARSRGYTVTGVEPDPAMHAIASSRGVEVIKGIFPDDLPADRTFDVIAFNDVLEHLPNPEKIVASCKERLNSGGCLVVNIPSSAGFFYKTATLLDRIGISSPFDRMWQRNFASPHISYFTPYQLCVLAEHRGLKEIHRSTLPSIHLPDLWARLRYDRRSPVIASAVVFAGVAALAPILQMFPADISLQIFRRD